MTNRRRQRGFSLTEVLIAVGTLAVGMLFVGGTFVLGVHFSVLTTEKTYAVPVVQKAENMIRLLPWSRGDANETSEMAWVELEDPNDYAYPTDNLSECQYTWAALVPRSTEVGGVSQAFIFVCRSVEASGYFDGDKGTQDWPRPVTTTVDVDEDDDALITSEDQKLRIGSILVSDVTGVIYRVIGRADESESFKIQPEWDDDEKDGEPFWIIPPGRNTGKNPCIGVFSREMRLN